MTDKLLKETEASDYLSISIHALRKWRQDRVNLPFVRLGRAVRYRQSDLDSFIADNIQKGRD